LFTSNSIKNNPTQGKYFYANFKVGFRRTRPAMGEPDPQLENLTQNRAKFGKCLKNTRLLKSYKANLIKAL
jgi:hypothetical protein